MKIQKLSKVPPKKIGRVNKNGCNPEPHESDTALCLAQFGLNIDFVPPRNTYRANSPDIFMLGSVWEMKAPTTNKESTIKENFRKAKTQSDRLIFDLRRVKHEKDDVKQYILKLFEKPGRVRRLIIIESNDLALDFSK